MRTGCPSTVAWTPWPVIESNADAAGMARPRRLAPATIAAARGCSLSASAAAATASSRTSSKPGAGWTSVSAGLPAVMVPVLSSTIVSSRHAVSRASAERMSIPARAPFPVPTMIDSGVARPSAHGQAMISTAIADTSARVSAGAGPAVNHTVNVTIATAMTAGTKNPDTASASRWIGALDACARCTILMIWASMVSAPTLSARTRSDPVVLIVAPTTVSPARLLTGIGSPVTIDSSTADDPDRTTASTGIFSPGRITTSSPTTTSATGISASAPPRTTRAVRACKPRSSRMACPVPALARVSTSRPSRISVKITPVVSKYTPRTVTGSSPGTRVTTRL